MEGSVSSQLVAPSAPPSINAETHEVPSVAGVTSEPVEQISVPMVSKRQGGGEDSLGKALLRRKRVQFAASPLEQLTFLAPPKGTEPSKQGGKAGPLAFVRQAERTMSAPTDIEKKLAPLRVGFQKIGLGAGATEDVEARDAEESNVVLADGMKVEEEGEASGSGDGASLAHLGESTSLLFRAQSDCSTEMRRMRVLGSTHGTPRFASRSKSMFAREADDFHLDSRRDEGEEEGGEEGQVKEEVDSGASSADKTSS